MDEPTQVRVCLQPVAMQAHARDMMSAVMLMFIVVLELTIMIKLGMHTNSTNINADETGFRS